MSKDLGRMALLAGCTARKKGTETLPKLCVDKHGKLLVLRVSIKLFFGIITTAFLKFCSDVAAYALKSCDEHGSWAMHPFDRNSEWTNYTPCSAKPMIEKRMYVSIGSYALSIIALIPALIIFQKFRYSSPNGDFYIR